MRSLATLIILVMTSALVACMPSAKNSQLSSIYIPAHLRDSSNDALNRLPYQAWWEDFKDPLLNQFVAKALLYNNNVTIAKRSIHVAQAELQTIRLNWLPGLNVLMGFAQDPALGNPGVFYGVLPSYYQNFVALYFQQKKAEFILKRAKAYYLGVRLTVIGEVMGSYFSLLAWNHQLALLKQIEQDNKKLLVALKIAKKQGLANNLQLLTVTSQLQSILGLQKQAQNNIIASENALRYLINQPPGKIKSRTSFMHLPSKAVPLNKINTQVILRRPDVMVALTSLLAACSGVNIAESQLLPALTLDYFWGKASLNGTFNNPTHSAPYGDMYATFNLSPSLFGQILTSKAIFNRSLAEYNNVIQNALRLIANSIAANEKLMAKYKEDYLSLAAVKKRYQLQQDLYAKGLISHNDLLYSRIEINQQAYQLTISKLEQLISVICLYEELAAGILYQEQNTA
ncbi:outer membrane efflux protein [Legionella cincinnatiensis]|uniref:Outer membrane efflux protein n=2 Tax=Legionella cincinnatiensis TaxID=28085 RepID=A0A378IP19_9GAMM|nr:outer membrane efflux protein [Legionella cincinnatiensis]STX36552.1 outer membrane efflux protein [Legionella cincinnatiensis]